MYIQINKTPFMMQIFVNGQLAINPREESVRYAIDVDRPIVLTSRAQRHRKAIDKNLAE